MKLTLEFHLLTSDRWLDLEALFGPRGAAGGCWSLKGRVVALDAISTNLFALIRVDSRIEFGLRLVALRDWRTEDGFF